jgi:hypothetical protein
MAAGRDGNRGGHNFDFDTEVCAKCGMTANAYDDQAEPRPRCTGSSAKRGARQSFLGAADDEPSGSD